MKKTILIIIITLTVSICLAQSELNKNFESKNNSSTVTYRLFPTQNMWVFIKLNTSTGQMWLVQFDVSEDNRFETHLNMIPLVEKEKQIDNRFTLYSTQNTWTFILLDQINGNTWQVQWSLEPKERLVIQIE